MFNRREFLVGSLWMAFTVSRRATTSAQDLRVFAQLDESRAALAGGVRFGIAEADRSAGLFGWRVTETRDMALAHGIIWGMPTPAPKAAAPVLNVVCGTERGKALQLAPCEDRLAWLPTLERFGAQQLNDRYRSATGAEMTSDAWLGWLAVKMLAEAALRARSTDGVVLRRQLRDPRARFDGHKGVPLRFDEHGVLVQPLYERDAS